MAFEEQKVRDLFEEVLKRLKISADKYKDAYVVNNMSKELNDEFYDIIGWPLMMVMRMREVLEKKIYDFDNIYWDKFLSNQETDFLSKMQVLIKEELEKRFTEEIKRSEEITEVIHDEIEDGRNG